MKVIHVVPRIDKEASGPSYVIPRLCQSLATHGNDVELMCLATRGPIDGVVVDMHAQWPVLERFAVSSSLARALRYKAQRVHVVHNHSLWSMVNVAAGLVVPGQFAKLVTSPHGTLSEWALSRSRHVKRLLWPLQRRALVMADLLHATSEAEYRQIRAQGFAAPVAIIPNGIDLPPPFGKAQPLPNDIRTLLFLSRIHPTKGLDRLLKAWAQLQARHQDWRLVVAGPGEVAHVREVKAIAAAMHLQRLNFPGPLYGGEKAHAYWHADLFVLPTHSENFGMVVAEALAHGCPAVVSLGAPWSGLREEGCGWWVDNSIETLTAALDVAMQLTVDERAAMGVRGRAWMERDYEWRTIGQKMNAAYRWLISGGAAPPHVRTD